MAKASRKKTLTPPRSAWESALEQSAGMDRSQAGEIDAGNEYGGGGDKGIDANTGEGGYGGDAALAGDEDAAAESRRPLDSEIHGDPRTHQGENYPNDTKVADQRQGPLGREIERQLENEESDEDWPPPPKRRHGE